MDITVPVWALIRLKARRGCRIVPLKGNPSQRAGRK